VQQAVLVAQLLTLLAVANGTPVIAAKLLGKERAIPLDGNAILSDGGRLFGSSKTLRGVILSVAMTTACAQLVGLGWEVGCVVGVGASVGLADLKAASSPDWTRSLSHSFPCLPPRRFFP